MRVHANRVWVGRVVMAAAAALAVNVALAAMEVEHDAPLVALLTVATIAAGVLALESLEAHTPLTWTAPQLKPVERRLVARLVPEHPAPAATLARHRPPLHGHPGHQREAGHPDQRRVGSQLGLHLVTFLVEAPHDRDAVDDHPGMRVDVDVDAGPDAEGADDGSLVVKRACRRSISTPPMIATAVWVGPTSHRPFRLVPAMIATEVS